MIEHIYKCALYGLSCKYNEIFHHVSKKQVLKLRGCNSMAVVNAVTNLPVLSPGGGGFFFTARKTAKWC